MQSAITPSSAHPEPEVPTAEEVLAELELVIASRHLRESHQLQAFLGFVVRETLEGRGDGLKEYVLGCRVFGRKPEYDPRQDGIVRVQATALRKRLDKYYAEEGREDRVVIELPRGRYVPAFRYVEEPIVVAEPVGASVLPSPEVTTPDAPSPIPPPGFRHRQMLIGFVVGALLTAAIGLIIIRSVSPSAAYRLTKASPDNFPQLWGPFFQRDARNLVAYGVPLFYAGGGLYLRDTRVNSTQGGLPGRVWDFARTFNISPSPQDDIYTGVGELEGTHQVSNFFTAAGIPVKVASARALGKLDLTGQNLVVISSLRFQTLLAGLTLPADFTFQPGGNDLIRNTRPLAGDQKEYVFGSGGGVDTSYAIVSSWPGPDPGKRIVHVGGIHTWATQAATEFVLDPEQLERLKAKFAADASSSAHGAVSPYFQILLRVEGRGNHSQKLEYVTHHYLAQTDTKK